jgi:2-polyprenyl-3-methyl-5-hydroxy-6-metoxy-1,4-benzoquinol methylase
MEKVSNKDLMAKVVEATGYQNAEDKKRLSFIIDEINSHLGFDLSKKVLEIGCGNGNICMGIASIGYQTHGVDIDEDSIRTAKASNRFPNLTFSAQAAENLSEGDKYDAIVCSEVLEHLVDPSIVLDYVEQYLKKDGIFISTVPNGFGPREVLMTKPQQYLEKKDFGDRLLKFKRIFGFGHGTVQSSNPDLEHIQFFSKKHIIKLHEEKGFTLKRFNNADSFSNIFPYSILTRRIKKLQEFDCVVADILPAAFTSGFYMSYTRKLS